MVSALKNSLAGRMIVKSSEDIKKNSKRAVNLLRLFGDFIDEEVAPTPYWEIGFRGRCRLLHFHSRTTKKEATPVLMIPSLINRYYILDLYKKNSIIQDLLDEGVDVYLLDWGEPRDQDRYADLDDHILDWMNWSVDLVRKKTNQNKVNLFGQCVGGTFSCIYTSLFPNKINSLALLTTPIDFHAQGILQAWACQSKVDLSQMVDVWGNIKEDFLDKSFKLIHPLGDLKKKQQLLKNSWSESYIRKYYALEKWLKSGVSFPGAAYENFINQFYKENRLIKGKCLIGKRKVSLSNIHCPVMNIVANGDSIVPKDSSLVLEKYIQSNVYEEIRVGGGHIGCLISDRHQKKLSESLQQWALKEYENECFY
ncbi:MAG: hypothetical protein CME63_13410 [Halobacteriovoraceae bacterium]|nr:hypothetical protein [Halobacteriovoraceae bacterium]|tara:strand:- start:2610 stop:3710 length:1101 start_codon:yes stop_codon:yes gene_type:complete